MSSVTKMLTCVSLMSLMSRPIHFRSLAVPVYGHFVPWSDRSKSNRSTVWSERSTVGQSDFTVGRTDYIVERSDFYFGTI